MDRNSRFSGVYTFPKLQDGADVDQLQQEFLLYQSDKSLPVAVLTADRADVQWNLIGHIRAAQTTPKYSLLSHAMKGILVILHSNADAKRVFSQVRPNQTDFRAYIGPKFLQSILMCKTNKDDDQSQTCHSSQFSDGFLHLRNKLR